MVRLPPKAIEEIKLSYWKVALRYVRKLGEHINKKLQNKLWQSDSLMDKGDESTLISLCKESDIESNSNENNRDSGR